MKVWKQCDSVKGVTRSDDMMNLSALQNFIVPCLAVRPQLYCVGSQSLLS